MIELLNISCTLGKTEILKNVSYIFNQNHSYAIFGKSGSGKSTLLKCIANLLPFKGQIKLHGKDILDYHPPTLRTSIIYLHQEPELLGETVEDDLNTIFNLKINKGKIFNKENYINYLSFFGYDKNFLTKKTSKLSGGQKQIAAILRSISLQPDFLLLDEPTSALDINTEKQFISILKQLTNKITIITVSHSVNFIIEANIKILFKEGTLYKTFHNIDEEEIKKVLYEEY